MSHATTPARPGAAAGRPQPARVPALIIPVYAAAVYLLLLAVPGYVVGLFASSAVPKGIDRGPRADLITPGDPGYDDAPPQAGQPETGRRRWAVLAVVSAAQFLTVLDLWVVNIALPALQRDFAPATPSDVSWILGVYAIVLAALLLPAGRAADSIGRRECFWAGLVVFGIASLGCAVAPDLPALIACRALQAAGAAVLMPASLGLALSVFPSHQRGTAVGVWAGVGAVAAGSGPVLGRVSKVSRRCPCWTPCGRENEGGCPPTSVVLGAVSPEVSLIAGSRRQGPALLP